MKYYCIKQHDITDCGAACLATIAKQNGYQISISKIREIAGTDKQGTNAFGVIKAAEQLGFSAKGVKGNKEAFFSEFPLPCIAHVIVNGNLMHYVVIHKIQKAGSYCRPGRRHCKAYAGGVFRGSGRWEESAEIPVDRGSDSFGEVGKLCKGERDKRAVCKVFSLVAATEKIVVSYISCFFDLHDIGNLRSFLF